MYILLDACSNPGFLRALYFVLLCMDVIFTIVPIGLIVMLLIDFSKAMIAGASDDAKKSTKLVGQRIISAIILFAIPWIVDIFMSSMQQIGFATDFTTCMTRARDGDFEAYDGLYEQEQARLEAEWQAKLNANAEARAKLMEEQKKYNELYGSINEGKTASGKSYSEAAKAMIDMALAEEGHVGGSKYIGSSGLHWCAAFMTWNLKNTTVEGKGSVMDIFGSVDSTTMAGGTINACANHDNLSFYNSNYYGGSYTPKKGDIIYFWYPSSNNNKHWDKNISSAAAHADHVGLVDYVENGVIYTVEGNTGRTGNPNTNKVGKNHYVVGSDYIIGFCSWYS